MAITEAATAIELDAIEALARMAAPSSVVVQLRAPGCSARELQERTKKLKALASEARQLVIVNDRIDVALACGADGVHLPGAGLPPREARRVLGAGRWLSRALHAPDELPSEELGALDAVVVSPVIAPRKGREALGLSSFSEWTRACRDLCAELGVFALGGVTAETAEACLRAGASGVAVLGAARDVQSARELVTALGIAR
jgi:thiamine-phosphate pyrophosphorylase